MDRFSGRTVVVTGGTGALGTTVVRRLLREGAQVAVPVSVVVVAVVLVVVLAVVVSAVALVAAEACSYSYSCS